MSYDNIQEAQLMRQNILEQIEAFNEIGFTEATCYTPLSKFADYIRWAGGLRDLRLATINKNTGAYADFSMEEWENLSASGKAALVKLGIRIRAERQDFIISKDNVTRANGATTMPWMSSYTNIPTLTDYSAGSTGLLNDFDGKGNTDKILAYGAGNNYGLEAAERARAYKASTIEDDGFEDPTEWYLPAVGQLVLIQKYRIQINAAITFFFGSSTQLIGDSYYWSSTERDSSYAWNVGMSYGNINYGTKNTSFSVRAVAEVPVESAI